MGEIPKVVIDTNIFVSGFGWEGKPKKILKLLEERKIKNFISPAIIEEVKRAISYKSFALIIDIMPELEGEARVRIAGSQQDWTPSDRKLVSDRSLVIQLHPY